MPASSHSRRSAKFAIRSALGPNLVSGIILLADKSIKLGDVISFGDSFGWVTTMGARYTSVITRDGRQHLIPNEDLITHRFGPQSTLDFILRFWIDDPVEGVTNIRGLMLLALWDALTRAGIEIPHYVSDMRMREPVRVVMQPHDKQPGDADEQGGGAPTGPT
jgi:small-conductance mechanosensitive channel